MSDSLGLVSAMDSVEEIIVHEYLHLLSITILFYDHLVTLGVEIDYVWGRPKSQGALWFLLNRYIAFFGTIAITVLNFLNLTRQSCRETNVFRQSLLLFNQSLVCVLLTLRTYALYNGSLRVLVGMVGSGSLLVSVACWSLFGQKNEPYVQGSGCHIGRSQETAIRLAGAWEALFVYDLIVFSVTMKKTWKARHETAIGQDRLPIIYLLFRDGSVYFAVIALVNLGNIMTFYFCGPYLRGGLSTFASAISVTMMSRLMLNVHQIATPSRHVNSLIGSRPHLETSPVWNVGIPLQAQRSRAGESKPSF